MKKIEQHAGFTLLEIIVSMVVIAILAGVVLGGARSLLHRQRYTDVAERVRVLVQQARNRSETQVESIKTFGVWLPVVTDAAADIKLFEDLAPHDGTFGANDKLIDSVTLNPRDLKTVISKDNGNCGISATILFTTHTESAELFCDNISAGVSYLKINLPSSQNVSLARSYMIHKFSGILQ